MFRIIFNNYKNKHIFLLILIFIINFVIISSYDEEFPFYDNNQKEKINNECKKNPIYCSMALAIEDIFTSIQSEEIITNNQFFCDILCLQYTNIFARDIICDENIAIKEGILDNNFGESYQIQFNNCNVLIDGKISYINSDITTIDFGTFLSEIKFKTIIFYQMKSKSGKIEVKFENNTKQFNYNRNEAFFLSEIVNMTEQMDFIMQQIYDDFINKIYDKINLSERAGILYETISKYSNLFSYFDGNGIYDEKKTITYIAYNKLDFECNVHLKDKVFLCWMNITFEYALNHNVTYNEGYFIINNIIFEEITNRNNSYKYCNISNKSEVFDYLENKEAIWETIVSDFKKTFNDYRSLADEKKSNLF